MKLRGGRYNSPRIPGIVLSGRAAIEAAVNDQAKRGFALVGEQGQEMLFQYDAGSPLAVAAAEAEALERAEDDWHKRMILAGGNSYTDPRPTLESVRAAAAAAPPPARPAPPRAPDASTGPGAGTQRPERLDPDGVAAELQRLGVVGSALRG